MKTPLLRAAVGAVILLLPLSGCAENGNAPGADTSGPGTSIPEAAGLRAITVGQGPVGMTESQGRVWVVDATTETVNQLSADLRGPSTSVSDVVSTPLRLVALDGVLWITSFGSGEVAGYHPGKDSWVTAIKVGDEPEGIAVLDGSLWVVLQGDAQLVEVDPRKRKVVRRIDVGAKPRQVAAAFGSLWVSDYIAGDVYRVNPATGASDQAADVCEGPQGMVAAGTHLWVSCTDSGELVAIDPDSLEVAERIEGLDHPDGLALDGTGRLVVALQPGPQVAVVDPETAAVVTTVRLGVAGQLHDRANIDILVVGETMLVSSFLTGEVLAADVP